MRAQRLSSSQTASMGWDRVEPDDDHIRPGHLKDLHIRRAALEVRIAHDHPIPGHHASVHLVPGEPRLNPIIAQEGAQREDHEQTDQHHPLKRQRKGEGLDERRSGRWRIRLETSDPSHDVPREIFQDIGRERHGRERIEAFPEGSKLVGFRPTSTTAIEVAVHTTLHLSRQIITDVEG